jgi:hypothetical protein
VTELRRTRSCSQITDADGTDQAATHARPTRRAGDRAEAPIFAADRVIDESAIEFEGEEVDPDQLEAEVTKFKHFLDEVTPDQFAVENGDEED